MRRVGLVVLVVFAVGLIGGGAGAVAASSPRGDEERFGLVIAEGGGGNGGRFFDGGGDGGLRGELPCRSYSGSSRTCEEMNGSGSFNTTCVINSSSSLDGDLCVYGHGSVVVSPHVKIICPVAGCYISINVSGSISIGHHVDLIAGSVSLYASNVSLDHHSTVNTTALAGEPPPQTSGTPHSLEGAGGGHGGRGASCKVSNDTNWGGDVYAWSTLAWPWSYGSKGGSMDADHQFGGDGGGRVMLTASQFLNVDGDVLAEGGVGSLKGGGGSGGSIMIYAFKLYGNGTISAAGGNGWGGGGGGRISLDCYSIQQDLEITVHGGQSFGCPQNAGAAGTIYESSLQTLKVSNGNYTTHTETPLLGFPMTRLWSNVLVECNAKVLVPLLWSRVQVTGQIRLLSKGSISFGLSENPISEFELVAEELLMSDSVIKVYGAFRMYVKVLLMWDSKIQIDGGGKDVVLASMLEARNLVVLRHGSVISSNAALGVYGQGLLNLTGPGDGIKARRLFLSLFYNIEVGPGSLVQAPLDDAVQSSLDALSRCESKTCPSELITPPDDCHVNNSLSFTLQICRVEDITVSGTVRGSIIHIHRARTVTVTDNGTISASELGCQEGIGKGKFLKYGAGGGAGHGGRVVGSMKWPLSKLLIYGSLSSDGESHRGTKKNSNGTFKGGIGGGSGGTILLFLQGLLLEKNSSLSASGGNGGLIGGGGGGGGRIHFHWSNIATGDEYVQIAAVNGLVASSGGSGNDDGHFGEAGTVTGEKCPVGLYGTFCTECPVGTYKNVVGSDSSLCTPCSLDNLPNRADFIYVRGGVTEPSCPYKCISSNALRVKIGESDITYRSTNAIHNDGCASFPFLLSLAEVPGASRAEETQSHAHRMYFMGPNTFREPWHLPYSPPDAIIGIDLYTVYFQYLHILVPGLGSNGAEERKSIVFKSMLNLNMTIPVFALADHELSIKVGSTPDLMVAYIDFFLGGDEKRLDVTSTIQKRFPMCLIFGGDGSYMSPYYLHSDTLLSNLLGQYVSTAIWNRLVSGLNAQMRTVRQGNIRSTLGPVVSWINSHGNPQLERHGVRVELGWFQATASCYYQLGIVVAVNEHFYKSLHHHEHASEYIDRSRRNFKVPFQGSNKVNQDQPCTSYAASRKRLTGGVNGGIINEGTLKSLDCKRDYLFPFSLLLQNCRPIGYAIVAIIYGALYSGLSSLSVSSVLHVPNTKSFKSREDNEWWILPIILFLFKSLQAGFVNWHVANLEIQDYSLFSPDPDRFWAM
uniref:DUF8003 domain-containing protein n=1 Tax=Leersia perrieri TaxID=77586 RepID=A0A0D9W2D7_9ORYZ